MANDLKESINEELLKNKKTFIDKLDSEMHFKSDFTGDSLNFDWIDEIESVCPYIDNIYRKPKLTLAREEMVIKVEKAKKITVASIKDLAKHTNYVTKQNDKTKEVEPEKILDIRNEETYNIYENRFLYTLLNDLEKFVMRKEKLIDEFKFSDHKLLEYVGKTTTGSDNINIELKITSDSLPTFKVDKKLETEIKSAKIRIKKIKEYLTSWRRCDMIKALEKAHVSLINPPVKKTNIFLKNPNFQLAVKLWELILSANKEEDKKTNTDSKEDNNIIELLDHSFLIDYYVLNSISTSKRKQKQKLSEYAIILLSEEVKRIISILLNSGIKITDDEILSLIAKEIKSERNNKMIGVDDVKKKFESAIDEYLERTQNYL